MRDWLLYAEFIFSPHCRLECDALAADMKVLHYACLIEAGDVLYEAGDADQYREKAQIIANSANQNERHRLLLDGDVSIGYQLDMAIVFVVIFSSQAEAKLAFATLAEMKQQFRRPDRPLHFEASLKSILDLYNSNLEDESDEKVLKIRRQMACVACSEPEEIEQALDSQQLEQMRSSETKEQVELSIPPSIRAEYFVHRSGSRVTVAVILCAFVAVTLVIVLIVWGYEFSARSSKTPISTSPS